MKKLTYFLGMLLIAFMSACSSGGYDQSKADAIDKKLSEDKELTADDYRTMVEQLNYILDDVEKSGNEAKWEEENPKEAEAMLEYIMVLGFGQLDENFPDDVKKDMDKIQKRIDKIKNELIKSEN